MLHLPALYMDLAVHEFFCLELYQTYLVYWMHWKV